MARVTVVAYELRGFAPVGGMGTATTSLALALARMGHDVDMLLGVQHRPEAIDPYWRRVYDDGGVAIRAAPPVDEPVAPWPLARARSIELGLRQQSGEVVIAHEFGAPAYTALRLKQAGLAFAETLFVLFCHGSRRYALDLSQNLAPNDLVDVLSIGVLEQACVELADVVVSPSAYLLDWMRGQGWRLPERSLVIPYFARADAMDEPRVVAARAPEAKLERLAFFGRVDIRKGVTLLASALNALEPSLLEGLELEFIGRTTPTWPRRRVEALLSSRTKRALRRIVFEEELDQHDALERLRRRGTLVVMPSLSETFSNTVYECLENRIAFIASNVGGVPELVARKDHARVLFDATEAGLEDALRRMLSERRVPEPARPAFDSRVPFERWAEVLDVRPRPHAPKADDRRVDIVIVAVGESAGAVERCRAALAQQTYRSFDVIVRTGTSLDAARSAAINAGTAPYVVFLDAGDVPEPNFLLTLVHAQHASGADVVTCGVRVDEGVDFFSGDPGGLGVVSNAYGTAALYRRDALRDPTLPRPTAAAPEWPLLASLVAAGADVVSLPVPLVISGRRAETVETDPQGALLAAQQLERALPGSAHGMARLAGGLAASAAADVAPPRT